MGKKINSNLIYDLDAINSFIFNNNERTSDVEITETQTINPETNKLETNTRIVREVKSNDSSTSTLKYDMLKTFMDVLDNIEIDQDLAPLSLGEKMVLNTMVSHGLIKEVKDK